MARRPRGDEPGSWHHVVNRAIAKRPYFEARSDKRYFLARLAAEVRAGCLEVHAFCLMTTHFHLLVRSPKGELSSAMRRVQNAYTRHFNRRRGRDGPLIRSRFHSKRVGSSRYRHAVVRYIDANAVTAGLVTSAAEHEFGSARAFVLGRRPPWLSAEWVERQALAVTGAAAFSGSAYLRAFGARDGRSVDAVAELVEARLQSARDVDPLDDLIGRAPEQVQRWLAARARLADGHPLGLPICGPASIARAIEEHVAEEGDWVVRSERSAWQASTVAHVGLLRDLGSMTLERIGRLLGLGAWAVKRRIELHRDLQGSEGEYGERVARIARAALDAAF